MFIAKNEENQLINLNGMTQREGDKIARGAYYCCDCGEKVILKKGNYKRPHFAHQKKSNCQSFSEGETGEHLAGKAIVMANATQFGVVAELEAYLPELKQRPDCLLGTEDAIEFQCSPLSYNRLCERTRGYHKNGYQVHWLLGEALFPKKTQRYLSKMQRQFLQFSSRLGYYLWGLSVKKKQLILCYGIEQKKKYWSAHYHFLSLEKMNILTSFKQVLSITETWTGHQLLLEEIRQNKQYWNCLNYHPQSSHFELQQFLYQKGFNLRQLPLLYQVPSLTDVLLNETELVIRIVLIEKLEQSGTLTLLDLAMLDQHSDVQRYLKVCPSLVSRKKVVALSCYRFLSFLEQVKLVYREKERYFYQPPTIPIDSYLKEKLENKVELVRIPLEYDMIKQ